MSSQIDFELKRVSTAEQVANKLIQMILSGELEAGEVLRENQLSTAMGISRNSLREGMRLLEQSRLVKYQMHRGTVVIPPAVAELQDLYLTRLNIEVRALDAIDDVQLQNIERVLADLEVACASHDANKIVTADLAFHSAFVDAIGSRRISEFYEAITVEMSYYLTVLSFVDNEYENAEEKIYKEHLVIYEALKAGKLAQAKELLSAHLKDNQMRLSEIIQGESA